MNEPSVVSFPFKNQDDKNNDDHLAVLKELENIDDECDRNEIAFVKISNLDEAKEYGLDVLPALVYFENRIPSIYEGVGETLFYDESLAQCILSHFRKLERRRGSAQLAGGTEEQRHH